LKKSKALEVVKPFQRKLLAWVRSECTSEESFDVFVHLRTFSLSRGRATALECRTTKNQKLAEKCLEAQYRVAPALRTYNELIHYSPHNAKGAVQLKTATFVFGDELSNDVEVIRFPAKLVSDATGGLDLRTFCGSGDFSELQLELLQRRPAIGLSRKLRDLFFTSQQPSEAIRFNEVRHAMQVLMLWHRTMGWRQITTCHARSSFDSLSGIVVTLCGERTPSPHFIDAVETHVTRSIKAWQEDLFGHIEKSRSLIRPTISPQDNIPELSRACATRFETREVLSGDVVVRQLGRIRRVFHSATFEGEPESFSFILAHPGFVARSMDGRKSESWQSVRFEEAGKSRELTAGAMERLNVIDVFGAAKTLARGFDPDIIPLQYPRWAIRYDDPAQAEMFSLAELSKLHSLSIVVGVFAKDRTVVFRQGVPIALFDGAWKSLKVPRIARAVLEWPERPLDLLRSALKVLQLIAYGPRPRSVLLGAIQSIESLKREGLVVGGFGTKDGAQRWGVVRTYGALAETILRASQTDGAILLWPSEDNAAVVVESRYRVSGSPKSRLRGGGLRVSSGTGDKTASDLAMAGALSVKVSSDGGLKLRLPRQEEIRYGHIGLD
jgi:hypothetical protein